MPIKIYKRGKTWHYRGTDLTQTGASNLGKRYKSGIS